MAMRYSKFELYEASVQDPQSELQFFQRIYSNAFGKPARIFREDFCSSFLNSYTWVKSKKDHVAYAVDMASAPLEYGCKVHYEALKTEQKKRLLTFRKNVLDVRTPKTDIIAVSNFSICFLKTREDLLRYFRSCYRSLKSKGVMVFDMLGGQDMPEPQEDSTKFKLNDGTKATYYWEHAGYNLLTNEAKFYIHYKIQGQKKKYKVFKYDWRMWSLPELKDVMLEAGFSNVDMYWEGDDPRSNTGNGIFSKKTKVETCPIWIIYVAGIKK